MSVLSILGGWHHDGTLAVGRRFWCQMGAIVFSRNSRFFGGTGAAYTVVVVDGSEGWHPLADTVRQGRVKPLIRCLHPLLAHCSRLHAVHAS